MGKTINTRIQLKSDTELNWKKSVLSIDNEMGTKENVEGARSFVPQKGEAIIFEPDNEHSFSRLKIGDGITNVLSLPFIDAGTVNGYIVRKEVPSNAEFTDTTYSSGSGISINNNNVINHTNSITPSSNSEKKVYKITYDSEGHITNAEEINVGTVKSVQIQASSPLQSSSSNLQTESLNTTISFIAQDKNTIFAGPTESATDTPSFRSLVEDDIPNLSASKITGTFSAEQIGNLPASKITSEVLNEDRIPNLGPNKISGVIPVSKGGTGVDGINGDSEHNVNAFIDNGIFAYDSINTRFKQFRITTPGNTDTFTSYVNSLNGVTGDLIVDLNTLIKAVPPINLNNPRDITQNYINSYYAPKTKGWKNSVLISQGEENFNEGTEPIWLNPTALSAEGFHGGTLFYGRYSREVERIVDDETVTSIETGFETQWGTLPVEQGGTGVTNFDNNIDKVLITAINSNTNAQYFSTITKTSDSMANTLVLRDSNSNFATNTVTISSGINTPSYNNLSNVITISNGVSTHYGNLAADNLTATIGTIEMSKISSNIPSDLPIINWYKSILDTKTKIGSIYWTIDTNNNGQASFVNISNDGKTETYLLPSATSTTDITYKILTTKNTLNGALYVSTDGSEPSWGTLPIAQGGTGVTTLYELFNEIKGTGLDNLGDATWVNVTGDTITGQLILNRATALTSNSESNGALIIGTTTNVHLAFDTDSIMAKNNTSVATLFINEFGGNVNILQASDDNYSVNIRSTKSSTSFSTGALVVSGGLGVNGDIYNSNSIYATGSIWAGVANDTTAERTIGVRAGSGSIYLYAHAATSGNRGLYIPEHGTGTAKSIITIDTNNNVNFYGNLTGNVTGNLIGNANTASLLKPIASTTTESASTWNIPSGSKQVWGERFSDTTLKYTNSNNEQVTITDTGDWTIWLTPSTNSNAATLNMRIDGTYYGSFNGNITGNLYPPVNGGIYWDRYVESSTDSSDATSIYQIATGVAGGTELRISQQNDSTDVINLCAPYYIYLNSKKAFIIYDSWLRINEDSGFSSGIYTGNSLLRTDAQLQVGGGGANFYANNSGNGYFSNTLGIAGANTGYNLYVNGSSYFNGQINSNNNIVFTATGTTGTSYGISWSGSTDSAKIDYYVPSSDLGYLRLNMQDDANARISFQNRSSEKAYVDGDGFRPVSVASSWLDGQKTGAINMTDATNTGSYWPWIRQTNTSSAKWFSIGTLNNSLYIIGSTTSRTENSYDYGWRFDLSNGWAYGNFSNSDTVDGEHSSAFLHLTGGTMTGNLSFSNSGTGFRGINYGTMGDNDQWRIGGAATASNAGYMEIATADDGNEPIYVRQYTGVFSSVTRTLTLLDSLGNTTIPRMLSVASTGETGSYDQAAMQIREYNYANANTDTWGHAPRLAWHWSGRVAAQIGLASNGYLYEAPVTGTTFYKIMYESGTWGINITGSASTANYLTSNSRMDYGWNGINYFNLSAARSTAVKNNQTPYASSTWTHILRFNHGNNAGYYTDLAIPFNANSIWYRRIANGALQNAAYNSNTGWVEVLDAINYTSYCPTKTGSGASGTWGINITGNAATATKFGKDSDSLISTSAPANDQVLVLGFKALRNLSSSISANDQLAFIVYSGSGSGSRKCKLWNVTQEKTVWQYA